MTDTLINQASGKIKEGDLVMVSYPMSEKTNNPAHVLDGQQFVVKTRRKTKTNKGGDTYQYELHGAESKKGKAFTFLTDELIRL